MFEPYLNYLFREPFYSFRIEPEEVLDYLLIVLSGLMVVSFGAVRRRAEEDWQSARASGRDLVRSYKLGVNAYVVKPVDFHQFVNAVKELGVFWAVINEAPPGSMKKN